MIEVWYIKVSVLTFLLETCNTRFNSKLHFLRLTFLSHHMSWRWRFHHINAISLQLDTRMLGRTLLKVCLIWENIIAYSNISISLKHPIELLSVINIGFLQLTSPQCLSFFNLLVRLDLCINHFLRRFISHNHLNRLPSLLGLISN